MKLPPLAFLFFLLAAFAVSAPAQNSGDPAVPTVTFDCSWEQATPQNFTTPGRLSTPKAERIRTILLKN